MIKLIPPDVWVFDCEWIPDADTGRRVYGFGPEWTDERVLASMWELGGATPDTPRPYLKTALCRVVSIAAVKRSERGGKIALDLVSLPKRDDGAMPEGMLIDRFLASVGQVKPQLVGFNSTQADLPALIQRALVHRITAPKFCARPAKPWEGIDYFGKYSDWNVDLMDLVTCYGHGKATPSLHQIAAACGIPGKQDGTGADVLDLWLAGDVASIVRYNERDALSTYLLWLRVALLSGKVTAAQFADEEALLAEYLLRASDRGGGEHLRAFVEEWRGASSVPIDPALAQRRAS
jgi:predicted PolB exonuclease-like 3'-5' exonuclease